MHTTPLTLLERVRRGADPEAWDRLVQLYAPLLFRWAQRAGASDQDAGDLVQDIFAILLQVLPTFQYDPNGKFRHWLHTVTVNKLRERQRRAAKLKPVPLDRAPEPELPDHTLAFWDNEYRQELIARALELLQTDFAPATWKACWEFVALGRPAEDVARDLSITVNAVYLAKCRVLRRLREELGGLIE